jgi:hypothetical protein
LVIPPIIFVNSSKPQYPITLDLQAQTITIPGQTNSGNIPGAGDTIPDISTITTPKHQTYPIDILPVQGCNTTNIYLSTNLNALYGNGGKTS